MKRKHEHDIEEHEKDMKKIKKTNQNNFFYNHLFKQCSPELLNYQCTKFIPFFFTMECFATYYNNSDAPDNECLTYFHCERGDILKSLGEHFWGKGRWVYMKPLII